MRVCGCVGAVVMLLWHLHGLCVVRAKYFSASISAVDVDAGFALIVLRRDATWTQIEGKRQGLLQHSLNQRCSHSVLFHSSLSYSSKHTHRHRHVQCALSALHVCVCTLCILRLCETFWDRRISLAPSLSLPVPHSFSASDINCNGTLAADESFVVCQWHIIGGQQQRQRQRQRQQARRPSSITVRNWFASPACFALATNVSTLT